MNGETFSIIGYASVALWLLVPCLWLLHKVIRPRRWLCHMALAAALAALVLAKVNSATHVNRIQLDRTEEMAAWEAKQEAARKAAEDSRKEDVAQIRFAEDASGDFLDQAGMDEADIAYMEKLKKPTVPEWKKGKKTRSGDDGADDLEAMIGADTSGGGMETALLEEEVDEAAVVMVAADLAMAHRLDAANLTVIRVLVLLGVVFVLVDYLKRVNVYQEAYAPLPLPSGLVNSLTPMPAAWTRPQPARRSMPDELAWLIRRGDSFLYLTDDPKAAVAAAERTYLKPFRKTSVEVLRVNGADAKLDDTFIFESLWYGRASFVMESTERTEAFLTQAVALLAQRKTTRARARQTVHLVWDHQQGIPGALRDRLLSLARDTGFTVMEAGAEPHQKENNHA